ncbi:DnaJ domain-containing protein [Candidatus Gracilibacteria bacterium]|nr:DnaJ domain-containing protein [Candidatus Gracilibacteria bacterium]
MQFEYYSILSVSREANSDEIKKAYRKKAMEVHPDRHGGDKTKEAEFKKLNEAYSVLSDEAKKAHYDRHGTMDNHGQGGGFGGFSQGFDAGDLGDIFSSFFGGGFGNGGRTQKRADTGEDIEIRLRISLEDAIRGTSRKIEFDRSATCHHCSGKGGKTEKCQTCQGQGQVRERIQTVFGVMEQARECGVCHGKGERIIEKCEYCNGKGKIKEKIEKTIDIPKGIENGMTIKLRGEGNRGNDGNGDLYITFTVPSSEGGLSRDGADLHYVVLISPAEAVLGVKQTLDLPILGKKEIEINAGTQHGTMITFRNEGMQRLDRKGGAGNLVIHIEIDIPTKTSGDQKKLYEAILQSEGGKMKKGWMEEFFGG